MQKIRVNMISESAFTVQAHGVHTAFMENLNSLARRADVDIKANTDRPVDIIHIQTVGPYSLKRLLFRKAKVVISAHVTPDSFVGSLRGAKYWYFLAKIYLRFFYNRADAVLAVSQEVADELKKMGIKKPIYLVPNTIDTSIFASSIEEKNRVRKDLGLEPNEFIVLSSGQVQPRKRVDTFIACAKALPQHQFIWVGGIPFKKLAADYEKMSELMSHPPENLKFTGVIDRSAVVDYYKAADLFFLPSVQETFGIVVVEAAAASLPVLLRDIPQYRITFNGWYEKGSEETFVSIIKRFEEDEEYYKNWQNKAAEIALTYDSKIGANKLVEIYKKVLNLI